MGWSSLGKRRQRSIDRGGPEVVEQGNADFLLPKRAAGARWFSIVDERYPIDPRFLSAFLFGRSTCSSHKTSGGTILLGSDRLG